MDKDSDNIVLILKDEMSAIASDTHPLWKSWDHWLVAAPERVQLHIDKQKKMPVIESMKKKFNEKWRKK